MTTTMVLGVNGQDGSFLANHLTARGYTVLGVDCQPEAGAFAPRSDYTYHQLDLTDARNLERLLEDSKPDEIYHFAAIHGPSGFFYEPVWRRALAVNTASLHGILEYARMGSKNPKIMYASSSKVFGSTLKGNITENSPQSMDCLYSTTKLAAEGLLRHYRAKHGVRAGIVYLFIHESLRRGKGFLFPKLAWELAHCLENPSYVFEVNSLSFYCDWGAAEEYMDIVVDLAKEAPGQDVIVATGTTWFGRDFVSQVWKRYGLQYTNHIRERFPGGATPAYFQASTSKLVSLVGRKPGINALDLCCELCEFYRKNHKGDNLCG